MKPRIAAAAMLASVGISTMATPIARIVWPTRLPRRPKRALVRRISISRSSPSRGVTVARWAASPRR